MESGLVARIQKRIACFGGGFAPGNARIEPRKGTSGATGGPSRREASAPDTPLFPSLDAVQEALEQVGLGSSRLILASTFPQLANYRLASSSARDLHSHGSVSSSCYSSKAESAGCTGAAEAAAAARTTSRGASSAQYEAALGAACTALEGFDDPGRVQSYGIVGSERVFSLFPGGSPAAGMAEARERYLQVAPFVQPTPALGPSPPSLAPAIREAMRVVVASGREFHLCLLLCSDEVSRAAAGSPPPLPSPTPSSARAGALVDAAAARDPAASGAKPGRGKRGWGGKGGSGSSIGSAGGSNSGRAPAAGLLSLSLGCVGGGMAGRAAAGGADAEAETCMRHGPLPPLRPHNAAIASAAAMGAPVEPMLVGPPPPAAAAAAAAASPGASAPSFYSGGGGDPMALPVGAMRTQIAAETAAALVDASHLPLAFVCIGVGDGPWDALRGLASDLPGRRFPNFSFIDFEREVAAPTSGQAPAKRAALLALRALQRLPLQYQAITKAGLLGPHRPLHPAALRVGPEPLPPLPRLPPPLPGAMAPSPHGSPRRCGGSRGGSARGSGAGAAYACTAFAAACHPPLCFERPVLRSPTHPAAGAIGYRAAALPPPMPPMSPARARHCCGGSSAGSSILGGSPRNAAALCTNHCRRPRVHRNSDLSSSDCGGSSSSSSGEVTPRAPTAAATSSAAATATAMTAATAAALQRRLRVLQVQDSAASEAEIEGGFEAALRAWDVTKSPSQIPTPFLHASSPFCFRDGPSDSVSSAAGAGGPSDGRRGKPGLEQEQDSGSGGGGGFGDNAGSGVGSSCSNSSGSSDGERPLLISLPTNNVAASGGASDAAGCASRISLHSGGSSRVWGPQCHSVSFGAGGGSSSGASSSAGSAAASDDGDNATAVGAATVSGRCASSGCEQQQQQQQEQEEGDGGNNGDDDDDFSSACTWPWSPASGALWEAVAAVTACCTDD